MKVNIRKADITEFASVWSGADWAYKQFLDYLTNETAETRIAEINTEVAGVAYAFYDLSDNDFADGKGRVYIANFDVIAAYRGQGIGTRLMETLFCHLWKNGIKEATVGVHESESQNVRLYQRLGFLNEIKRCGIDPICVGENSNPIVIDEFVLLMKVL